MQLKYVISPVDGMVVEWGAFPRVALPLPLPTPGCSATTHIACVRSTPLHVYCRVSLLLLLRRYTVFKDHVTLDDYEIHDVSTLHARSGLVLLMSTLPLPHLGRG